MPSQLSKIVLTGAAGALGHELRAPLAARCKTLLSTDIVDPHSPLLPNETWAKADIAHLDNVMPLMAGSDMVVHFAAIPDERPFEDLLGPNYLGAYTIWESAHRHGVRRVVYASSIHAVGMHDTAAGIDITAPHRPDTFYGLAKCFAEDLARLYWEKRGIESVCLRIMSCTPEPENLRALGTWLSYGDLVHLVERAIDSPTVGFTTLFGVSKNDRAPVNNAHAAFLGYRPKDNAEDWAPTLFAHARQTPDPQDPAQMRLGGPFATVPLGESGVAQIKQMTAPAQNAPDLPKFLSGKGMGDS